MNPERTYFKNGQIKTKSWWLDGKRHRLNGPAFQEWHKSGHLIYEEWYVDGEKYKPKNHPFNVFRKEHNLLSNYDKWPTDMKMLFRLTYL